MDCIFRVALNMLTNFALLSLLTDDTHGSNFKWNHGKTRENLKILVFGGNGFLGASTVQKLLERGDSLTLLNRGNWHWDSASRIKPHVRHISCDRMQTLRKCTEFQEFLEQNQHVYFDAVVDFSAYHPFAITDGLEVLEGKIGRYVYISSDSVYEVCVKTHQNPSREEDAVRPKTENDRESLNKKDDYGHRKLACEEELVKQRASGGIPFISLRLPDVIGERDSTMRWWIYQIWLKLHDYLVRTISVPEYLKNKPLSLVYSQDVADAIMTCLDGDETIYDQAYNLAFHETLTLPDLLSIMKQELGLYSLDIRTDDKPDSIHLYPSVERGPVDITKAQAVLNWRPSPLPLVVKTLIEFYEHAILSEYFRREQKEIIRTMQTYFTKEPFRVIRGLKEVYSLSFPETKDEL